MSTYRMDWSPALCLQSHLHGCLRIDDTGGVGILSVKGSEGQKEWWIGRKMNILGQR